MIIKPELLRKIRHYFGLNIYEAKVWTALLSKGVASAGEIAEISDVPRSRTYDVLESLAKQGFVIEKLDKPLKYIAVHPSSVIERLKNNASCEVDEKMKALNGLKDTSEYTELEILYKQGIEPINIPELSGAVKGRGNFDAQIRDMIGKAKEHVVLVTTVSALRKESKFLKPLFDKLQGKGVDIKVAVNAKPEDIEGLAEYKKLIRPTNLNARLCIVDNKQTIFALSDKHEEETGIWINSPFFTSALKQLFDNSHK